ncbi:hypothetical protein [Streptomyces sp. NPDC088746]|uniref:hypothetical protein n=1 Tax=Streptomyces sp. NPDC088746 TaxID=3365885 RepID=UPI0038198CBF
MVAGRFGCPLTPADTERLACLLDGQPPESRGLSTLGGYGIVAARKLGDAIARYDKLRLVLEEVPSSRIVGLLELGLALALAGIARYRDAAIDLTELIRDVARRLGRTGIILCGDVLADNARAIRYYEKYGFPPVGSLSARTVRCPST